MCYPKTGVFEPCRLISIPSGEKTCLISGCDQSLNALPTPFPQPRSPRDSGPGPCPDRDVWDSLTDEVKARLIEIVRANLTTQGEGHEFDSEAE